MERKETLVPVVRVSSREGCRTETSVIDVGGGTSFLVDNLVARGFTDVSVLDVSASALETARDRVKLSAQVDWLVHDVLTWQPARRYGVWHDRAVFHFLVDGADRQRYLQTLRDALEPVRSEYAFHVRNPWAVLPYAKCGYRIAWCHLRG